MYDSQKKTILFHLKLVERCIVRVKFVSVFLTLKLPYDTTRHGVNNPTFQKYSTSEQS